MNIHHYSSTRSRIELYGDHSLECGYCKNGISVTFGGLSSNLLVEDYDMLMQRGWSRSAFKLSRSQRKTIRRAESIVPKFANVDGSAETTSNTAQAVNIPAVSFTPTSSSSLSIPKPGLSITIERAEYTQEKYLLYSTYMQHIHNKSTSTASSFCDFLVVSPLVSPHNDAYGTFHMCYRLVSGGSLVAVSVLDFLPSGMISVYCFYDPTYKEYALGKYTILQEIRYCQQHDIPAYYLGYYVHSSGNMRYKADYQPADLLCPIELSWHRFGDCLQTLNVFDSVYGVYVPFGRKHGEVYDSMKSVEDVERYIEQYKSEQDRVSGKKDKNRRGHNGDDDKEAETSMTSKKSILRTLFSSCHQGTGVGGTADLENMHLYLYNGRICLDSSILNPDVEEMLCDWVKYGGQDVIRRFNVLLS